MRFLSWRFYLICAFLVNCMVAVVMWSYLDSRCQYSDIHRIKSDHHIALNEINEVLKAENFSYNLTDLELSRKFMILMRDFEFFENDVTDTVKSIVKFFPLVKILIVSERKIYPPLVGLKDLPNSNVQFVVMKPLGSKSSSDLCPQHFIDRERILFVPDSVRFDSKIPVIDMLKMHLQKPHNIVAAPVGPEGLTCLSLNVSLRHWTIKYKESERKSFCEALHGDHVILFSRSLLMRLTQPFARPFPHSLYIQSALFNVKVEVLKNYTFRRGKALFTDPHSKWKHNSHETVRKQTFYQDFGIKKVLLPASRVEWYGCNKSTQRCFGTVVNDMPEYLFEGRWTPPCCLENLRQTARYVFNILEKCNVRYWLEGGSLLGAVRTGDIIPWDYDVDIGIYKEDIPRCEWLKNSEKQSIIDSQGFVWEKAKEGDFIRVQYSQTNHLHVDIFPFFSKNGIMTKDTWFVNHKQDMEFPEHFLQPLEKVKFVGVRASAPNHQREFLELKFGKNAIETPKYPVPEMLMFSRKQ